MPTIAISIKTFARPAHLRACVHAAREHLEVSHRFYIADDSPPGATDEELLQELRREGHYVRRYPGKVSVTRARNELLEHLGDESHLLRLDDDFELSTETHLGAMIGVLDEHPAIGAVAGVERQQGAGRGTIDGGLSPHQGYFFLRDATLHKLSIPVDAWIWSKTSTGTRFAIADYTRNLLLIRRNAFTTTRWNESLTFSGEHEAFMLDLKRNGWLLAFTPDSVHSHNEHQPSPVLHQEAKTDPQGRQAMARTFQDDYGIREIILGYPVGRDRA